MGNTGSSKPKNKTGKSVVAQKLANASKLGVLSLSEHKLKKVPEKVLGIEKLTTLDLSKNALTNGDNVLQLIPARLAKLKTLNLDSNKLYCGSLPDFSCSNLQTLQVRGELRRRKEHLLCTRALRSSHDLTPVACRYDPHPPSSPTTHLGSNPPRRTDPC